MIRTLVTLLFILLLSQQAMAVTLKIATLVPDGTSWMQAMRAGAEEVERTTEGRVKLRFYPGGVMGNDNSVLRKIRVGQLHGGALSGGGLTSIYPDSQIYNVPFLFQSYDEVRYVHEQMDPILIDGLRRNGFVSFGFGSGGFAYLMSQKPVTRVTQLKHHKVWIPEGDEISRRAMEAVGVSPIQLPLTDVLTGLQTGLIDTLGASPVGAIGLQWHTRLRYLTDTPLLYLYGTLVIQNKAFERLTEADQQTLNRVMAQVFERISAQNQRDNEQAREALLKQGIQFVQLKEDDLLNWRQTVSASVDQLGQGGAYSQELVEQVRAHLKTFRSQ